MAEMDFAVDRWVDLKKLQNLAKLQRLGIKILTAEKTSCKDKLSEVSK